MASAFTLGAINASSATYQYGESGVKDVWVQPTHAGEGNTEVLHVFKSSIVSGFRLLYEIDNLMSLLPAVTSSSEIDAVTLILYMLDTKGSHGSHAPGNEGLTMPVEISAMANSWTEGTWAG